MGLIHLWRTKRRADRLMKALEHAAENPDLYLDPAWQTEAAHRAADVIEVVPMPPRARSILMGFLNNILKNWKTTLIGLATGAGIAFLTGVQGGMTPKDAALAAGVAALGLAAKDGNVSGK